MEGEQPAGLAVLSRERRRQGSVPGLRRPAGQQLLGRRQRVSRRHHATRAGRTSTAATASGRSPIRPIRTPSMSKRRAATSAASIAGRTAARDIQPKAELQREAALQLEHADRASARTRRARSTSARSSCSARATTARPGSGSRRTSPPTIREKQKQEQSGGVTVDNSSAEMHTTIYSISESPKKAERDLGRHRRRQPPAHARRRQDAGRTWSPTCPACRSIVGELGRGGPLRRRHRVRGVRSPHVRRHRAVGLPDHRLRQDLDTRSLRQGARRARLRARDQGGHGQARTALRRHRVRPVDLDRRRPAWAQFKGGDFPAVAVRDMAFQDRDASIW